MQPTHLAILGRQPELGLLELESRFGSNNITLFGKNTSLVTGDVDIDRFGGLIKVGEVLYQGPAADLMTLGLDWLALGRGEQKTTFGLSYYGLRATPRFVLATGLELKKVLKAAGPVRLVSPTDGTELTAAQLLHNHILADGFELLVVVAGGQMVVARTTGVQDIEAYGARDHGRPARDAKVGMLPPKLAQILINTTKLATVVDPFCGTGVVLQEALLAGRAAVGSDLASDMVAASETNLEWLADQTSRPLPAWSVSFTDAKEVKLPSGPVAIVTEGYLGPNLSTAPSATSLDELDRDTSDLYRAVLANWGRQLPSGAELAICIPNWRTAKGWRVPAVVDDLGRIGYTVKVFKHVPGVVRYARSDQIVGRQLLLLTRS